MSELGNTMGPLTFLAQYQGPHHVVIHAGRRRHIAPTAMASCTCRELVDLQPVDPGAAVKVLSESGASVGNHEYPYAVGAAPGRAPRLAPRLFFTSAVFLPQQPGIPAQRGEP